MSVLMLNHIMLACAGLTGTIAMIAIGLVDPDDMRPCFLAVYVCLGIVACELTLALVVMSKLFM